MAEFAPSNICARASNVREERKQHSIQHSYCTIIEVIAGHYRLLITAVKLRLSRRNSFWGRYLLVKPIRDTSSRHRKMEMAADRCYITNYVSRFRRLPACSLTISHSLSFSFLFSFFSPLLIAISY